MNRLLVFIVGIFCLASAKSQTIMNTHFTNGDVLQLPMASIDSITYTEEAYFTAATVTTSQAYDIEPDVATIDFVVSSDGGLDVTQKGLCWNTVPNPTIDDFHHSGGSSHTMTNLLPGTTYYARGYAINAIGLAYGNEIFFTTDSVNVPTLAVNGYANVSDTLVNVRINILDDGGAPMYAHGICWGYSPNPTVADNVVDEGTIHEGYFGSIDLLFPPALSTIYLRTFATNLSGTGYGTHLGLTTFSNGTPLFTQGAGVTDIDGNFYETVIINGQEWMAENLRTSKFANGDSIAVSIGSNDWSNIYEPKYCWYDHDSQYDTTFGKFYNKPTIVDSRNVCPTGWHLPSKYEWNILALGLDPTTDTVSTGGGRSDTKLFGRW